MLLIETKKRKLLLQECEWVKKGGKSESEYNEAVESEGEKRIKKSSKANKM